MQILEEDSNSNNEALQYVYVRFLPLNSPSFVWFFFFLSLQFLIMHSPWSPYVSLLVSQTSGYCFLWSCRVLLKDRQAQVKLHISAKQAATEDTQVMYLSIGHMYSRIAVCTGIIRGETGHAWTHDSLKQNKGKWFKVKIHPDNLHSAAMNWF